MGCNQSSFKKEREVPEVEIPENFVESRIDEGRRFHNIKNAKYFLPNDDEEMDRLHLQHYMWRYIWQCNYSAPVDDLLKTENTKVLDLGCGAGSWLFELATDFPSATFTGIDISPVIPTTIKPRNVFFTQGDILDGLPFEDNTFDFVHQRILLVAFSLNEWQGVVNEMVRVLKPGGYLELMEVNAELAPMGPNSKRLCNALIEYMTQQGQDPQILRNLKSFMEVNGQLENIVEEEKFGSYGIESGRLGQIGAENHISLYTGFKPRLLKIMDISSNDYDELVKAMAKELPEYKSCNQTVRVYGRKKLT